MHEKNQRLTVFDGIRGLAILLVVLNHIKTPFISSSIPSKLAEVIFSSGITGVSFLFILSGFLMAYIYPHPANPIEFLQKRYTRIFPLFLTMCSSMSVLQIFPTISWIVFLAILLFFALCTHVVWVYGIGQFASNSVKTKIFFGFVLLQIFIGIFYVFWIMKHPPIVFNQELPFFLRETIITLVNATVTLPFGNYIPMLDGVYWSLISEIYFYILYPFLCVPLIYFFMKKRKFVKIMAVVCLIPFFAGLDKLSHKIFLLSMLQIPLCFYFITGIILGYTYFHHKIYIEKLQRLFFGFFSVTSAVIFFLLIVLKIYVLDIFDRALSSWIHIFWAFPITFIIAIALNNRTAIARIINNRLFIFLGIISYSIYVSHTAVIYIIEQIYKPTNFITNVLFLIFILISCCFLGGILYYLLERPYFQRKKEKQKIKIENHNFNIGHPLLVMSCIFLCIFIGIIIGYQSNFNFFSLQYMYTPEVFISPKVTNNKQYISMQQYPKVDLLIPGKYENFSAITMHIIRKVKDGKDLKPQKLIFRIKDSMQKNWFAESTFDVVEIGDSLQHPFGFPFIAHAKGHIYIIELVMSSIQGSEYIVIDKSSVKGIYQIDKFYLMKHPLEIFQFVSKKITNTFENRQAQDVIMLMIPFTLLSFVIIFF
jgi:peptidoglycan/LPS O-acetylase OafA/YrhL